MSQIKSYTDLKMKIIAQTATNYFLIFKLTYSPPRKKWYPNLYFHLTPTNV